MKHEDKDTFARKMVEMLNAFTRRPEPGIVDSYFNQLASIPLQYILEAIDQAIRNKRDGDLFDQRSVPTVPEVAHLAREAMDRDRPQYMDSYCDQCSNTGWILEEKDGRKVARKCECLLRRIDQQRKGPEAAGGKKKVFS